QTLKDIQAERARAAPGSGPGLKVGGSVADKSLGLVVRFVNSRSEWFLGGLRGFWQEAQAYYRVWPFAGALLGYLLVWPVRVTRAARPGQWPLGNGRSPRLAVSAMSPRGRDRALLAMAA